MKTSLVITVLNEEKTIKKLLLALVKQTKKPDEIFFVDGGSTDKTIDKVKEFQTNRPTTIIYIIVVKGANRAKGRNEGVRKAGGEIIAVSDAGCILDEQWVEKIVQPLENGGDSAADVVAGYYKPIANNIFEKCLSCYTSVMPDKVDPEKFLPSSRSIAFKKTAWQEVGGYPENLDYCEDLVFAKRLKEASFKFKSAPQALVYWPQKENIFQAFKQFFNYALGDTQARYWPHLKKIRLVYLRYLIGLIGLIWLPLGYLLICLLGYFFWAIGKNYRYIKQPLAFFYLPILQVTADLAVMSGAIKGLLSDIIKPKVWGF